MKKKETIKEDVDFIFSTQQQEIVCEHFGKDINKLQTFQICNLLDRLINEL